MAHEIIPPHLAIKAMRDSGYRDASHALAELIDNSIQAGQNVNKVTNVEVLCVDTQEIVQDRQRNRINRVAVYDDASGMDMATLRLALQFGNGTHLSPEEQNGIGKFGMGLPNSSISQCRRVDVWSWQDGKCLTTYLDIDQVMKGEMKEVPEPKTSELPTSWRHLIANEIGPNGTLVVWTKLDRIKWKTSKSLLENTEFLVGRIYRYFINDSSVKVRLAAFTDSGGGTPEETQDYYVRPNDPLYLMTNTSTPVPYDQSPAFDHINDETIKVKYRGKDHTVIIRYSVTKAEPRQQHGGSSPIGQHAAKNQGVSLVRARREIEMNRTFENRYDPTERWWGIEVLFEPGIDEVLGVTNNKQSATAFCQMDLDEDAKAESMTPQRYREYLGETEDTLLIIYEISQRITKMLSTTLRPHIKRFGEGTRRAGEAIAAGSAEDIATRATRRRRATMGDKGRSDKDEKLPESQRQRELTEELISEGVPELMAKETAISVTRAGIKFIFQEADVPGAVIFDVKSKAGTIIILLNSKHPAREHLFELLENKNGDTDTPALKALKLLLSAWARLEDEAADQRRQQLEDIRADWGRLARDFFKVADE